MSDLISREALINEFKNPDLFNVTEKHLSIIGNAPAVDAVEVVRCKDCQHYPQIDCFREPCCNTFLRHSTVLVPRKSTDYCSYGKRRESEVSE